MSKIALDTPSNTLKIASLTIAQHFARFVFPPIKSIPLSYGITRDSVINLMGKPSFTEATSNAYDRWLYYANPNHSYYIELKFNNDTLCYIMQWDETTSR